ncbi:type I restriction-modification system DNA methylase subunit [Catalinimonas alkaloidigena]|uniref:HsdM family class I SAM-dependent methyltransferase n=1 Tax=Catalinimonas alkaloidigena TaxID=1075417 RepID=UPI0024069B33|nr:N-6 DNA methylase [Catalinimonas alkaloidigena]MDF9795377.1 type I restriction-modification system DNA methylase subunit [Catalinimonas alkaloidigena]
MLESIGFSGAQAESKAEIEAMIRRKNAAGELYSEEEKALLREYEGAGGISDAEDEYAGAADEFYTPDFLIEIMWDLAKHYGFPQDGKALEPSCGTGRFFDHAPDQVKLYGMEINPISFRIAQILHPQATLYNQYFETLFLEPPRYTTKASKPWLREFELIIGNPPYGTHLGPYASYFNTKPRHHTIENFFLYYGLKLLKKNGLIVFLTSSNFLRNGDKYKEIKQAMGKVANLVDAYRLPAVFRNSSVPTDILVLKKL